MDVSEPAILEDRFRFLARASAALGSSLDYETTLRTLARLCVPVLADWCAVDLLGAEGDLQRLAVTHVDPERERWGWEVGRRYPPRADAPHGVIAVLRSGRAELYAEITDEMLRQTARDSEHLDMLRALGLSSAIIAPLTARGRTFGALTLVAAESNRRYGAAELELASELADRAALAVDNARLHGAEAEARRDAERAAERTARLLDVTSRLARDLSPGEVAATMVDHGIGAMGATAGAVMRLDPDQRVLELLEYRGYSEELVRPYRVIPLDAPVPNAEAARTGQPVFLSTRSERAERYPALAAPMRQTGTGAIVSLPLLAGDRVLGVLGLSFADEREFTPDERAFMLTLAAQCAQALDRARTVAALQRSERRSRSILESNMLGIGVWTAGRVTEANDALLELLGWTREELAAGALVTAVLSPAEYRDTDMKALEECVAHGTCRPYEKEFFRKDGTRVPVLVGGAMVEAEPAYQGVFFVLDLTDRRNAEARLHAAQRMEAVGRLAGGVAHEINNALQGVLGFAGFARRAVAAGTQAAQDVEEIQKAAVRAADITQQLLAFSRRQVRRPTDLDLGRVVTEFTPMMQQALGPERELVVRVPPGGAPVLADRGQLEQVLLNLTLNARDAMPGGGQLTVSVARHDGAVYLEVADTGGGMDARVRERVFEPFFTTKGPGQGTGLGLSVVHGIVHQSGGRIAVESVSGRGSVFRIELPAAGEPPPAPVPLPASDPPLGRREKLLVVDDDPAVLGFAARTLEDAGYQVLRAANGADALQLLAQHPDVALVLSDLIMPVLSGRVLGERISREHPAVRVAYMSGRPGPDFAGDTGAQDGPPLLQKPFAPDALLRQVRTVLDAATIPPRTPARTSP
jgi:PAS domain S-box-containing protein